MMKRKCQKCGEEYQLGQLSFDSGLCGQCKPGFFGEPLWMQPVQAGTKDLWRTVLVIHVILLFLFGLIRDCREISTPGGLYCFTIILYLTLRFVIARFKGYPILTKNQAVALLLLPAWGPFLSVALFNWAQRIRWGP